MWRHWSCRKDDYSILQILPIKNFDRFYLVRQIGAWKPREENQEETIFILWYLINLNKKISLWISVYILWVFFLTQLGPQYLLNIFSWNVGITCYDDNDDMSRMTNTFDRGHTFKHLRMSKHSFQKKFNNRTFDFIIGSPNKDSRKQSWIAKRFMILMVFKCLSALRNESIITILLSRSVKQFQMGTS